MAVAFVQHPDSVRAALTPLRTRLLQRLHQPASAVELAPEFGMARQKLAYHLRALEAAGLLELVEERQRRGCTERVLRTTAAALVVDPMVLQPADATGDALDQDRHAATHLVATSARVVRDVGRMQSAAAATGKRLLTFTLEAELSLASPGDLEHYAQALADAVASVSEQFNVKRRSSRRYRVVVGGYPA